MKMSLWGVVINKCPKVTILILERFNPPGFGWGQSLSYTYCCFAFIAAFFPMSYYCRDEPVVRVTVDQGFSSNRSFQEP